MAFGRARLLQRRATLIVKPPSDSIWPRGLAAVSQNASSALEVRGVALLDMHLASGRFGSAHATHLDGSLMHRVLFLAACGCFITTSLVAQDILTFEKDVRPILKAYCLDCHGGGDELQGKLDLRLRRFVLQGGESGAGIVLGRPDLSLLIKRMKSGEMPPSEKKVPKEQVAIIERWIASDAVVKRDEPEALPQGVDITPEERAYWFFQPLHDVSFELPVTPFNEQARTPIDRFILAKQRERFVKDAAAENRPTSSSLPGFAADADKRTLIRRAAFDLHGLPPTQADIDAFVADQSENAYETMLGKLLDSPHYGERWGRHWLDVAGYADSEGNGTDDSLRPYAYKFRDYVIRSFNADKPFDQFLIEQLAGDELVAPPWKELPQEQLDKLIATSFLRCVVDGTATGGADEPAASNQVVADALKVLGTSLYGLTIGCAQCHDHRYDPIPQSDYFRLRAVFEPAFEPNHWRRPGQRLVSLFTDADRAKSAAIEANAQRMQAELNEKTNKYVATALDKELLKYAEPQRAVLKAALDTPDAKRTDEQKKLLASHPNLKINSGLLYQFDAAAADELKKDGEKIAAKRAEKPIEDFISILAETPGVVTPTRVFYRGDYRQPKQVVMPGDLTIAGVEGARFEIPDKDPQRPTTGRRLALAKSLTNGKHPLVGRVLMNRVWMHHFGRGIVETAGDFGMLGTKPTHPELLDWLAIEFARQKWSLKRMHRLIMTSTVYRQSSADVRSAKPAADVTHYARFPLRRLDAEALRDTVLAVSGKLDRTQFGPPVPVIEDFVGQVLPEKDSPRRSVYLQVRRTKPVSLLTTFDAPVMEVNCERRISSTSAPQSLMLMNSDFMLAQAGAFAQRIRIEPLPKPSTDQERIQFEHLAAKHPRAGGEWQFGFGGYDETSKRTTNFTPLVHWTGSSWQGSATLPDPQIGYVIMHASGGHTGNDLQHASVRRWTAPRDGIVSVTGKLHHPSENGDGVRSRVISNRSGLLGEWRAKKSDTTTNVDRFEVQAGDTLDFATDCFETVTSDSFGWSVQLKMTEASGQLVGTWDSEKDFHGPLSASLPRLAAHAWHLAYQRPPTGEELALACQFLSQQLGYLRSTGAQGDLDLLALTSLCQQLLISNEFLYVD